ncbi:MAG: DUF2442 domain-containing protein [Mongoliibacter sp.]|jgi:hypothetical protein|uniref:DUF2442 domain-containing protein n=1 Tax=Mongoliibacter sp. TaxID=2022438 RepID=UPI0012F1A241|nr:DUF2442 domain-containing protein [Mongoliibacter sp.]TVP51176.1 MAG: DUF2442 domain-containing protein [Mongoliibacter sp.]
MKNSPIHKSPLAKKVWFDDNKMFILLEDGRELGIPLEWFPRLRKSTKEELSKWRLIGDGEGIHWDSLDEDILVGALL